MRTTYRPEIDGLRALAVIPVVLFHAKLGFSGGYVGVDIFFVISGYLITSLILADLDRGTFRFGDFWERRVRRILPASLATVFVTAIVGYFLLLPADFRELGQSIVAQAALAANVFFHLKSGYFAAPAEIKPLLHFWSLAVEEQFYVVFPFLLYWLHRYGRGTVVRAVALIMVGSFVISAVGIFWWRSATFYLLPARAWELGAGALLALARNQLPLPERWRASAGWMGLALLIAPMFLYTHETLFPGPAAIPPCLGTVLIIWATGGGESPLRRLLAARPLVGIGLISYSLYLWHWPVNVYSHYWFPEGLPLVVRVATVALSFALAWLSWRYIELPFRQRRFLAVRPALFAAGAAAGAASLAVGCLIWLRRGEPDRFPPQALQYAAAYEDRRALAGTDLTRAEVEAGDVTTLTPEVRSEFSVLIWGDSHARVVSPAVEEACRDLSVQGYRASRSASPPLLDWGDEEMRIYNRAVFDYIARSDIDTVILASRWEARLQDPADEAALRRTVEALRSVGAEVLIMRQVPLQDGDVPKLLARAVLFEEEPDDVGVSVDEHRHITRTANTMIDAVASSVRGVSICDPVPYLSREGRCFAEHDGRALYYDHQHLTRVGAALLRPMFTATLRTLAAAERSGDSPGAPAHGAGAGGPPALPGLHSRPSATRPAYPQS